MNGFSHTPTLIALAILSVVLILVITLLYIEYRNSGRMRRFVYPIYDYTIKKAQKKARKTIWQAQKQAREMLVEAELKSIKKTAEHKLETRELEESYEEHLSAIAEEARSTLRSYGETVEKLQNEVTTEMQQQFDTRNEQFNEKMQKLEEGVGKLQERIEQEGQKLQKQYNELATSLESSASRRIQEYEESARTEIDSITRQLKESLQELEKENKEQLKSHLDDEFTRTRELIDDYRKKQYALIDKHIVGLVERVAATALQKELTINEHADLVYEALERARDEGIFTDDNDNG